MSRRSLWGYGFRGVNANKQCAYRGKETIEKCFPLLAGFKFKEGKNFNHKNT
jgi:hypothetical protein